MHPRRLALCLLASAGVAVGHIVGYGLAHPSTAAREAALGGHDYLPAAASLIVPAGVVAALVWAVRASRDMGLGGTVPVRTLAAMQVGLFAVQEVVERVATGQPATAALAERGVWFGLVAQVVVAAIVVRAVSSVRRVIRMVSGARPVTRRLAHRPGLALVVADTIATRRGHVAVGLRAPPIVV